VKRWTCFAGPGDAAAPRIHGAIFGLLKCFGLALALGQVVDAVPEEDLLFEKAQQIAGRGNQFGLDGFGHGRQGPGFLLFELVFDFGNENNSMKDDRNRNKIPNSEIWSEVGAYVAAMKFVKSSVLAAVLCGVAGAAPETKAMASESAASAERPNIVFLLTDDLGYGDVDGNNPKGKIPTPGIDRPVREGMRFSDAHSASAVCSPTRYGLLTGRYPWRRASSARRAQDRRTQDAPPPTAFPFSPSSMAVGDLGYWKTGAKK
jgi:hypothetical protein